MAAAFLFYLFYLLTNFEAASNFLVSSPWLQAKHFDLHFFFF